MGRIIYGIIHIWFSHEAYFESFSFEDSHTHTHT